MALTDARTILAFGEKGAGAAGFADLSWRSDSGQACSGVPHAPMALRRQNGVGRLPAPVGQADVQARDLVAPHGLAEAPADLGQDARVLVVGGGLDDGLGPAGGVVALEDA